MSDDELFDKASQQEAIRCQIDQLTLDHRKLDRVIADVGAQPSVNQLQLKRLKKDKLALKDQIERLKSQLLPDILA